jgi:hypothetical protein
VASIEGLYLNFAVICEKVLREADEVLSLIRIVDQLTVTVMTPPGVDAPQKVLPTASVPLIFAVGFKSAGYVGPVPVRLRVETPSGSTLPYFETNQPVTEGSGGVNLLLSMQLPVQEEGLYWFVVEVSGDEVTRVPLRISTHLVEQTIPPQG